jgi:hypothetical protein
MSLPPARAALVVAAIIVLVLGLAVVGRDEAHHANRRQVAGIVRIASVAATREPSAYRIAAFADCLLYPEDGDPYAEEVCFDAHGRAVEAIDRHPRSRTRIWSVRYDPALSTVIASPQTLFRRFRALGAFPKTMRFTGTLPLAAQVRLAPGTEGDSGPILVRSTH